MRSHVLRRRPRLIVPLALAVAVLLAGCTGTTRGGPEVEGHALTFEPRDISVRVGDNVTFQMVQGSHTVDFAEGDAPVAGVSAAHSGHLDPGDPFQVTFTQAGTYEYFCLYHSSVSGGERVGMVGTVTVAA